MDEDTPPSQAKKKRSISSKKKQKLEREGDGDGEKKKEKEKEREREVLSTPRSPHSFGRRVMNFLSQSTDGRSKSPAPSSAPSSPFLSSSPSANAPSSSSARIGSERNIQRPSLCNGTLFSSLSLSLSLSPSLSFVLTHPLEPLPLLSCSASSISQSGAKLSVCGDICEAVCMSLCVRAFTCICACVFGGVHV